MCWRQVWERTNLSFCKYNFTKKSIKQGGSKYFKLVNIFLRAIKWLIGWEWFHSFFLLCICCCKSSKLNTKLILLHQPPALPLSSNEKDGLRAGQVAKSFTTCFKLAPWKCSLSFSSSRNMHRICDSQLVQLRLLFITPTG